jgi:hypothetical protein
MNMFIATINVIVLDIVPQFDDSFINLAKFEKKY